MLGKCVLASDGTLSFHCSLLFFGKGLWEKFWLLRTWHFFQRLHWMVIDRIKLNKYEYFRKAGLKSTDQKHYCVTHQPSCGGGAAYSLGDVKTWVFSLLHLCGHSTSISHSSAKNKWHTVFPETAWQTCVNWSEKCVQKRKVEKKLRTVPWWFLQVDSAQDCMCSLEDRNPVHKTACEE